jgi:DNA-binding CsgD family transcriptional regulator
VVAVTSAVAREFALSDREEQVLLSAAVGKCTKETALHLGISGKTVEYFWARVFRKMGCRSQLEVMSLLLRRASSVPRLEESPSVNPPRLHPFRTTKV